MGCSLPMRGWLQAYVCHCAFPCATGGLPGLGFRMVRGMPHRDVGDDAFSAVLILGDHVVREPDAGLLLDGVNRNGERSNAGIQIVACSEGARFRRACPAFPFGVVRACPAIGCHCKSQCRVPRAIAGGETGVGLTVLALASTPSTCALATERTRRGSEMIAADCCRERFGCTPVLPLILF